MIQASSDLNDQLQLLVDHLQQATSSTAVYIGKLVSPKKPIQEADDDEAHLDNESEKCLLFQKSDKDHRFIVDSILEKSQGLTFDVFKDPEPDENAEPPAEGEVQDQGPRHILVPEVVREPRIHFYKVPRLGSYLAIKLEYKSCLSTASYDAGLKDYNTVKEKRAQQQIDIKEWEEQQLEK